MIEMIFINSIHLDLRILKILIPRNKKASDFSEAFLLVGGPDGGNETYLTELKSDKNVKI